MSSDPPNTGPLAAIIKESMDAVQVAQILGVKPWAVHELRRRGRLGYICTSPTGRRGFRFTPAHVAEFLASAERPAPPPNPERSLAGRIGAHTSWAQTHDRTARTRPGRVAFDARFEREVDPDGVLPAAERARRATNARKAHFARMALKSAAARRRKTG